MADEVVRKDNAKLVALACPSCGVLYSVVPEPTEQAGIARARDLADKCCPPRTCTQCHAKPVARGATLCPDCQVKADVAVEAQRSAAATKLKEADWQGPVFWPNAPFDGDQGDCYWSSVAALRADVAQHNAERKALVPPKSPIAVPAYVYVTRPVPFLLNGTDAISAGLKNHPAVAASRVTDAERARLQKFLDDWASKQRIASYEEDLTRIVVLGP